MKRRLGHTVNLLFAATLLASLVMFTSCTSRRSKEKVKDLIPANALIPLLTDIYLADGLMTVPEIGQQHRMKDSVMVYIEVVENYGYTKKQVDQTLRYYFINRPKKLQKIYDQVLARLSEMESVVMLKAPVDITIQKNLWPGKIAYAFPEDGLNDPVYFDVVIPDTGLYRLKASIVIYADDQSDDPRITVWFWKADTSALGATINWQETVVPKDGISHQYTLEAEIKDSSYTNIRGWLLNHTGKPGHWEKHSRIDLISLTRVDKTVIIE
jgi:hypothetical protein